MYLFFFSCSRLIKRSKRDWNSDVCSSYLAENGPDVGGIHGVFQHGHPAGVLAQGFHRGQGGPVKGRLHAAGQGVRSEERSVGNRWREEMSMSHNSYKYNKIDNYKPTIYNK